jgi:hypothetical protein
VEINGEFELHQIEFLVGQRCRATHPAACSYACATR